MQKPLWLWIVFLTIIIILITVDLGILHRKQKVINIKHSLILSSIYISIGLLFGFWIWIQFGAISGQEYLTGFLIEKCLSFDNIFAISMIFSSFAIERKYQHRVLFYGILGAIILRAIMIGLGAKLISELHWLLYVLAIFLMITGIKMLIFEEQPQKKQLEAGRFLKRVFSYLPIKKDNDPATNQSRFYVYKINTATGKKEFYYTNLLLALVTIEVADIIFALDSVPAILAITNDTYVIYTSNIFAILGLRALYFTIAAMIERFHYLRYSLAIILTFIGAKIFIADLLGLEKFPASISLAVTVILLAAGIMLSFYKTSKSKQEH
jgi:tellurite resistance protein TerC